MSLAEMLEYVEDKAYFDQVLRQLDAPSYAIKNPTVVDRLQLKAPLALDDFAFLRRHTRKPIKVTLPGPYLLTRSMWVKGISDRVYPKQEDLAADVVRILREEVIRLRDADAAFIQLDEPILTEVAFHPPVQVRTFMCASIAASTADPSQELLWATHLLNAVTDGIEGSRLGVHICRGNWSQKEEVLLTGNYEPLISYLILMRVRQWVLEFATPRAGELAVFRPYPALRREIGLGVANPRSADVEAPEAIVTRVEEALHYFAPSQIFLNPDCGFGTFAERPITTPDIAASKLRAMVAAAETLRRTHGAS
jgi:5-methyltetrahydropteroyltriglutamate--homocysteine methyltransferase